MTREQILSAKTIKSEAVPVPEWGGTVFVRTLNSLERVAFFEMLDGLKAEPDNQPTPAKVGMLLVVHCLFDDQGQRILEAADADALMLQSGDLMNRLCAIANRLNGIGDGSDAAAAKK